MECFIPEGMERASGIYLIRHNPTGEIYIGQAEDLLQRFKDHKRDLQNPQKRNRGDSNSPSSWSEGFRGIQSFAKKMYENNATIEEFSFHTVSVCSPVNLELNEKLCMAALKPEANTKIPSLVMGPPEKGEVAKTKKKIKAGDMGDFSEEEYIKRRIAGTIRYLQKVKNSEGETPYYIGQLNYVKRKVKELKNGKT